MLAYTTRRLILMLVTMVVVSILAFLIIDLPPGDYLASYIMRLEQSGQSISQEALESLRRQYGLDLNLWQRYTKWMWNFLHGDLGRSFEWNRPVSDLLAERLPLTIHHIGDHPGIRLLRSGPGWHLFGASTVLCRRLPFYRVGILRVGDPQLSARPRAHVLLPQVPRVESRRAVFHRVSNPGLELCQVHRPVESIFRSPWLSSELRGPPP